MGAAQIQSLAQANSITSQAPRCNWELSKAILALKLPVTGLGLQWQFNSSTSPSAQPTFLLLTLVVISRAFPTGCVHVNLLLRACFSVSKAVKSLRFFSYLQVSMLTCHRFREAGKRHKNPWVKNQKCYFGHSS